MALMAMFKKNGTRGMDQKPPKINGAIIFMTINLIHKTHLEVVRGCLAESLGQET
jgi:hypothetical protein